MTLKIEHGGERLQEMVGLILTRRGDTPEVAIDIINGSIKEALDMAFGDQLSKVVQDLLSAEQCRKTSGFETECFLSKLKDTFGDDSELIERIIYGRMLARFYLAELREKIGYKHRI